MYNTIYNKVMLSYIILLSLFSISFCKPEIIGYWEGYSEYNVEPYPIDEISTNVTIIQIAFIAPAPSSNNISTQWSFGISTAAYMPETILKGIKKIKKHKQKILVSLMDTGDTHWNTVDVDLFSYNLLTLIETWDLDGVNIDSESAMSSTVYVKTFIKLIKSLRKYLGPLRLITYSTYGQTPFDTAILNATSEYIDMVQTMSYWEDINASISTFNWYANAINDSNKVALGFSVIESALSTVEYVGNWLSMNGYNKMMLWSVTQDVPGISGTSANTWIDTMYNSLQT